MDIYKLETRMKAIYGQPFFMTVIKANGTAFEVLLPGLQLMLCAEHRPGRLFGRGMGNIGSSIGGGLLYGWLIPSALGGKEKAAG